MLLVAVSIVLGIAVGLASGGSLSRLAETRLRAWPLAILGLGLQVAATPAGPGGWLAGALLGASYLCLGALFAANVRLPGVPLVAVGIALNALVIGVNGGMPVSDDALRAAYGTEYEAMRRTLIEEGPPQHHLARPDDVLLPLADVIGIRAPVKQVFSVGDLTSMGGFVWLLAAATRGVQTAAGRAAGGDGAPRAGPVVPSNPDQGRSSG